MEIIMKKTIITVVGKDSVGIIAKVCTYLSEKTISQTIVDGYFNMMMIVNMEDATKSFAEISEELEKMGEEIHCIIRVQREEIFDKMHRI